jgi:hypothetical protein
LLEHASVEIPAPLGTPRATAYVGGEVHVFHIAYRHHRPLDVQPEAGLGLVSLFQTTLRPREGPFSDKKRTFFISPYIRLVFALR